jgi:outer membrane protein assembly factor BamB
VVFVAAPEGNLYAVDRGVIRWRAATSGGIMSSPATDGRFVYVGSNDGSLYAFDIRTGATVWSTYLGPTWIDSSPAYANGVVYVGAGDSVVALDALSGGVLWSYATSGIIDLSSPAVTDGTVYIGSTDGYLYAFR